MKINFFLPVVIFLSFSLTVNGCGTTYRYEHEHSSDDPITKIRHKIGTAGGTDQKFHIAAVHPDFHSFRYDGFHIGVEKSSQSKIVGENKIAAYDSDNKQCQISLPGFKDIVDFNTENTEQLEKFICDRLSDSQAVFVTHILDTKAEPNDSDLYNLYRGDIDTNQKKFLTVGLEAIKYQLDQALIKRIHTAVSEGNPYTHIIVMSTGWNNFQMESFKSYNTWSSWIDEDPNIRALYITFSWPSLWGDGNGVSLASIRRKRNDADEVGLLPANVLINQVLSNRKKYGNQKIVLLGHSFGARILSRALYSADLLEPENRGNAKVDTLIGLQPAFSMNRFHAENSEQSEGYPYRRENLGTRIFLTTSKKDQSVKWFQSRIMSLARKLINSKSRERNLALGPDGWTLAEKDTENKIYDGNLTLLNLNQFCQILETDTDLTVTGEIFYLESSKCIWDHNDVFRQIHGNLIRALLKSSAPFNIN